MLKYFTLIVTSCLILLFACCQTNSNIGTSKNQAHYLQFWNEKLTDVIVEDIFTPPVASRIYAYPNIAAYEILVHSDTELRSLTGQLNDLTGIPQPEKNKDYDWSLAAIIAFSKVAQELVNSKYLLQVEEQKMIEEKKQEIGDDALLNRSVEYGQAVSKAIIAWMNKDNYKETRAMSRYVLSNSKGAWQPTPPDYMPGIEPNWELIRAFTLDSANQYPPLPPTAFDSIEQSLFFKEAIEVYETVNGLDEEKLEIAKFWDCNPNASIHQGHFMYFLKKISPGGHWMGITNIATQQEQLSISKTSEAYTIVAIALADAFISCWNEKYRSILIRPETYINEYIDSKWEPILQTPAFPEYTSGHSVVSSAAAVVLTNLLGDNFAFVDSVEAKYGLTIRSFNSFYHASEEAAVSRLYGGIHYMPAISNGIVQGKKVGNHVIQAINTRHEKESKNIQ